MNGGRPPGVRANNDVCPQELPRCHRVPGRGLFFYCCIFSFFPAGSRRQPCLYAAIHFRETSSTTASQTRSYLQNTSGSATHKHSAQEIATGSLRFAVQGRIGSCAGRKQKKKQKTANRCENHETVRCRNLLSDSLSADGVVEGCSLSLRLSPSEPETSTCSTRLG